MSNVFKSVRVKLAVSTAFFSIILIIIVASTVEGYVRDSFRDDFDKDAKSALGAIKIVTSEQPDIANGQMTRALDKAMEANSGNLLEMIKIEQLQRGEMVAIAGTTGVRIGSSEKVPLAPLLAGETFFEEKGDLIEITQPLEIKGYRMTWLTAYFSTAERNKDIMALRRRSAIPIIAGLLVMMMVIYLVGERFVLKPIDLIKAAAGRISAGDFDLDMNIRRNDELGELSRSLQTMKNSLVDHAWRLKQRINELSVLYDVSELSGEISGVEDSLRVIVESAVKVLGATAGLILIKEKDQEGSPEILQVTAVWPPAGTGNTFEFSKSGRDIARKVVADCRPTIITKEISMEKNGSVLKDAICVPIKSGDEAIGAICIVNKVDDTFDEADIQLLVTLANQSFGVIKLGQLHSDLQASYLSTIQALAATLDAKDHYTRGHSDRVARYSEMLARHMGLGEKEVEVVRIAAYLHDIGKIGIEEHILGKPAKLTDEERELMQTHPSLSAKILSRVTFLSDVVPVVKHHHESFDGKGYPDSLAGLDIPSGARILSVADSFDAMVSNRPYRSAMTVEEAVDELNRCSGTQFDPEIVKAFVEVYPFRSVKIKETETLLPERVNEQLMDV